MNIARLISALTCGLLFGLGLAISGMVNPAKVLAFLNVTGAWDPSLAGVMAGAIPVTALYYRRAAKVRPPAPPRPLDRRLIIGAVIFGAGWGLIGFCPGPAIAALALDYRPLVFLAAMAGGICLQRVVTQRVWS